MAQASRVHAGRSGPAAEQNSEAASYLRARATVRVQHPHAAGAKAIQGQLLGHGEDERRFRQHKPVRSRVMC